MRRAKPELVELDVGELNAILERSETGALCAEDREKLRATIATLAWVTIELEKRTVTIALLRKGLSISTKKTEKTSGVLEGVAGAEQPQGDAADNSGENAENSGENAEKKKPKGHGRNGADAYEGAEKIEVPHESVKAGDLCPKCGDGKLSLRKPRRLVRLRAQAPISGTRWELGRLRCNLCGHVFTAKAPPSVGKKKHDETVASMIGLLKYGTGLPFNRLANLQGNFGIPLPASTQYGLVADAAETYAPAYQHLVWTGAQGHVLHHDDTPMKILELLKQNQRIEKEGSKERTGMYTTGVVSLWEKHQIVLFFTGRQHAGENLRDVLQKRAPELAIPLQMCDGSSRNKPKGMASIEINCLTHGRRKFVELAEYFPPECRYLLETLREVYNNDRITREQEMSPEERLRFHQAHSAELMADLKCWMSEQLTEKKVEPNSSLGDAFSYMLNRWTKLTVFLREPGAPLDNNICEQALKKAILHRKNALFYKTLKGARVGDILMSLIYTAELSGANPFDYLTTLLKHPEELERSPHEWMPWNYQATAAALAGIRSRPPRASP